MVQAAVASRDWGAELASATGGRPDAPVTGGADARLPLPASWDPGAGPADPHLRANTRPMAPPTAESVGGTAPALAVEDLTTVVSELLARLARIEQRLGQPVPTTARGGDVLDGHEAGSSEAAAGVRGSAGPVDHLAKVLGGRLDAVVARLGDLEATVRRAATQSQVDPAAPDSTAFERLEQQIIQLNRILQ